MWVRRGGKARPAMDGSLFAEEAGDAIPQGGVVIRVVIVRF